MRKVFISYSHKDEKWKDHLMTHLKVPAFEGHFSLWDDRDIQGGDKWFSNIEKALNESHVAIMLISANFLTSDFILREEVPRILGRYEIGKIRIIPFILKPCAWKTVTWLSSIQVLPKDGRPLSAKRGHNIDAELANLAEMVYILIKTGEAESYLPSQYKPLPPEDISLYKLPVTGPKLFGREKELKILDEAWENEHTHLVSLVAWGGVGKTALVNYWLNLLALDNFRGAQKMYGWSFYSQGAAGGRQVSADEFMQTTLKWFGDKEPAAGSPVDKGRRLARLIKKYRTLLILDGLEPLQYPPGEVYGMEGQLKDLGLKTLLKELAASQPGLCVITSREKVTDVKNKIDFTVKEIELEHLSDNAGVQLLKSMGIKGLEKEILETVQEYEGHALSLNLLGQYLHSVYEGDIRKRDKIPQLTREKRKGGHVRRVIEAYERWLGDSAELDILRMMGLFDQTVKGDAIEILKGDPPIQGVTDKLHKISKDYWQYALNKLRTTNLLDKENPLKPDTVDCHPLIREHFGEELQSENPKGWKEAHKRLYHYYKDLPKKELPDTLQEMEPLFAAVAHGCQAGLHQEVLIDVYWNRISRTDEFFCTKRLGAFGLDLATLSHFFEKPWNQPAAGLNEGAKAVVLNWAAFSLRAGGRLWEALQPMQAGLEMHIKQEDWVNAAKDAGNLSELALTLGRVKEAVEYARKSVTYADRNGSWREKLGKQTTLADALHQFGQLEEAEKLFLKAEAMQKEKQPEFPYLYGLWGFQFCYLLLVQGKYQKVIERVEKLFEWRQPSDSLFTISLENLTAGRAWMMKAKKEKNDDFSTAKNYLDQAMSGLRKAGQQQYLPPGLFASAKFYRLQGQFSNARDDLNEAEEIAEMGSMNLYLADYHLEAGHLCLAEGNEEKAWEHFHTAKKMIDEMGYHRRDGELGKLRSLEVESRRNGKKAMRIFINSQ